MNRSCTHCVLAFALALCSFAAAAQTMQAGLWEFKTQVDMGGAATPGMPDMKEMQEQLAQLPPEQRQMLQDMMAKNGMGADAGNATAQRICVTPAMLARQQLPVQMPGNCRTESAPRNGNTTHIKYACSNPSSSGEGDVTVTSPGSYSMKMIATTTVEGQAQKITVQGKGRWLAADCGGVLPMSTP
jgi:hypothetical protein